MKILIIQILLIAGAYNVMAEGNIVNFLDADTYGFESGGDGWYLQHPDFWSFSTEKSSGSYYNLKYSCDNLTGIDYAPKAQGSGNGLSCDAGTYTMKVKVWVDEACMAKGFSTNIKKPWKTVYWSFDGIARGKWVELSKEITLATAAVGSGINVQVSTGDLGTGIFYVDDIGIWGQGEPPAQEMPLVSFVETNEEAALSLEAGSYNMSLKVWVDEGTSISGFYTSMDNPFCTMEWDLSTVKKRQWVSLNQDFELTEPAAQARFKVLVSNHPDYSGGTGAIHIDDIQIRKADVSVGRSFAAFSYKVFPNPSDDLVYVDAPLGSLVSLVNMMGVVLKKEENIGQRIVLSVNNLSSGMYFVLISNKGDEITEKISVR